MAATVLVGDGFDFTIMLVIPLTQSVRWNESLQA